MLSSDIPRVTCEHLATLEKKGAKAHVIIDLRELIEFEAGHIKDSVNIPHRELESNIHTLLPEKNKKVIVIVGPTQEKDIEDVHKTLSRLGYKDVEFLAGGFDAWCEIAPIELEPDLTELTPEEQGFTGQQEDEEADPTDAQSDPLM
jgi:rhodanese-related sulfurtransferase